MSFRDKTLGELFPNAVKRWPRTFMLGVLLVTVVVTGGILVSSVVFLGVYGPVCLSIGALIYTIGAAVYGDLQDLKRKKP